MYEVQLTRKKLKNPKIKCLENWDFFTLTYFVIKRASGFENKNCFTQKRFLQLVFTIYYLGIYLLLYNFNLKINSSNWNQNSKLESNWLDLQVSLSGFVVFVSRILSEAE